MNFLLRLARFILKFYIILYLFFHVLAFFHPGFVKFIVFQNMVKWPLHNFKNPSEFGLTNVHNFYYSSEPEDVRIGVWHFVPKKLGYNPNVHKDKNPKEHLNKFLKDVDNPTVIIYVHGNDRDRATPYRRELCSNLVDMGYHVFALDYRGYGDSTGEPTEDGVVADVLKLYELVRRNSNAKIFFYGHSLGCGIVCHATKILSNKNEKFGGVILEAPFLNASLASKDYFVSLALNNNKWIQTKVDEALEKENIHFNNDKNILEINSKILIMHADGDWFIPQYHSIKLKEISKKRPKHFPEVKFVPFGKELGLGHFLQSHKPIYTHIKKLIEG